MILVLISEFMQDEIYLREESKYYEKFEKVIFYSVQGHIYSNARLRMRDNMICGKQDIAYSGILHRIWCLITGLATVASIKEFINMIRKKTLSIETLKALALFTAKSKLLQNSINNSLERLNIENSEKIVFYSYRFGVGVSGAIKLKRKYRNSKVVARCHGQDLFEFRNSKYYLPYRKYLYSNVDELYCISEDGRNYIAKKYDEYLYKTFVYRLGTRDIAVNKNLSNQDIIIVTCSRIAPIKRLDMLAKTLCLISDTKVKWIHYGDGDIQYKNAVKKILKEVSDNIAYEFAGFVDNNKLIQMYSNKAITFFLNVSESEGLPVAVMEAMAAGIPIVATDVGGTREAVVNGYNGFLIKKDFEECQLIEVIQKIQSMNTNKYKKMCLNSRKIWEDRFSSANNYSIFAEHLSLVSRN